jgi:hypothetical protein
VFGAQRGPGGGDPTKRWGAPSARSNAQLGCVTEWMAVVLDLPVPTHYTLAAHESSNSMLDCGTRPPHLGVADGCPARGDGRRCG